MRELHPVVLVTGSSGLIGSALCVRLMERFEVIGFDRPGEPHPPAGVDPIDVDLTSDASVAEAFRQVHERHGREIAAVIHLAAYYDFSGKPSPMYEQVTVAGTGRLLRALQDFRVAQFIFSSTMLVHAPCPPGCRINELSPIEPLWDYPRSKVQTENLIRRERGQMPSVILRIAGVYDEWCHSIPIAHQIQRIREGWLTGRVFPGDTRRGQSFVHLDDLLDVFERCIDERNEMRDESVFVIGEPETIGYAELQRIISRALRGKAWRTWRVPKVLAKIGAKLQERFDPNRKEFIKPWMIDRADDHYELDISRARTMLGWEPRHSLRDTLPTMIAHLQEDPVRWYRENKLELPATERRRARTPEVAHAQ
jgi:nucleoside-diphosphate-sugar epimerase